MEAETEMLRAILAAADPADAPSEPPLSYPHLRSSALPTSFVAPDPVQPAATAAPIRSPPAPDKHAGEFLFGSASAGTSKAPHHH